jgi:hypothetical protein
MGLNELPQSFMLPWTILRKNRAFYDKWRALIALAIGTPSVS